MKEYIIHPSDIDQIKRKLNKLVSECTSVKTNLSYMRATPECVLEVSDLDGYAGRIRFALNQLGML